MQGNPENTPHENQKDVPPGDPLPAGHDAETAPQAPPQAPPQDSNSTLLPSPGITALDFYKGIVDSITKNAHDPAFRATFKEYLSRINPNGDEVITAEEMANAGKDVIVDITKRYNDLIRTEIEAGTPPEDIVEELKVRGAPQATANGTPSDFAMSAMLEKLGQECKESAQNPSPTAPGSYAEQLKQLADNYGTMVTALQLRSGFVGDLVLSEEKKALIPKLHSEDAYSLPLFIQVPTKEQLCDAVSQAGREISATDPLRPLDTPAAPHNKEPAQER